MEAERTPQDLMVVGSVLLGFMYVRIFEEGSDFEFENGAAVDAR